MTQFYAFLKAQDSNVRRQRQRPIAVADGREELLSRDRKPGAREVARERRCGREPAESRRLDGGIDALAVSRIAELLELTPVQPGPLKDACGRMPLSAKHELEARFDHCHDAIAWDRVAEAQAFAGKPTGAAANGCEAEIEDYGRLQVFVHLDDATIWRVEFFGAVGRDGKVVGLNGEVACKIVPEAPKL